ncbi:MAG TPA: DUF4136 domain-containing protein [Myxococcota bacterium]|nr:DUF4136 domain-containing protein [Myxococcota bacterium]
MNPALRVTLALSLSLWALACSSIDVKQDWDPNADFAKLHTWAWQSSTPSVTGNPRLDDPLVHARIQGALEKALAAKGFAKESVPRPDFLVAYHIAIQQKLDARTIYTGYGPYRGWYGVGGAQTVVDEYDVGTLLVDFIDPDSNSVIWRGSAQSRLQELKTPEERQARIQTAVDQVLAQFPPTKK